MKSNKITILYNPKKITLLYSLYPFWKSRNAEGLQFTTNLKWVKEQDKNEVLLIVGWFWGQDKDGSQINLIKSLKAKYRRLAYFDDSDGSESSFLDLLPHVDLFYKKQLFKDKSLYMKDFYGRRIFSDYYHQNFGIEENPSPPPLPKPENESDLDKMNLAWNIAIGQYPSSKARERLAGKLHAWIGQAGMSLLLDHSHIKNTPPRPSLAKCQARFDATCYRDTVGYQREHFQKLIEKHPSFITGRIPLRQYNKELSQVHAILSPYGWGEICFRDIEAILNGSVLIKPDMGHLDTWPNLYKANQTYESVSWDGTDLLEKTEMLLSNPKRMELLSKNAFQELQYAYAGLDMRVKKVLDEIRGVSSKPKKVATMK
ncbi:hypothetical protein KI659_07150 [Litoribacter alkaliphilus]|uniref:Uncharacterized protein n=1 Tax=Litoribacter ruber TaxID=702568 RepID=A0AAP2G104_9BACT|nr:hypothetical protein [Litoribacter alkaliphilus]MBS9523789.1 hypothetical protein [Litoribacter alkaliphilus]